MAEARSAAVALLMFSIINFVVADCVCCVEIHSIVRMIAPQFAAGIEARKT
jgi:hypothetical protein